MDTRADILIFAGEYSGNLYGTAVARALKERAPKLTLAGTGCVQMERAGVRLMANCSSWGGIGPVEVLKRLDLYVFYYRLMFAFRKVRPRLVLLIDYPFFNMRVAKLAKSFGIPSLYYFPPGKFKKKPEDIRDAAVNCTRFAAPFRFTHENYVAAGANVDFVGHPLFDILPAFPDKAPFRAEAGCKENERLVTLLPGSRLQEVEAHTPRLIACASALRKIYPSIRFCCPIPDLLDAGTARRIRSAVKASIAGSGLDIPIFEGKAHAAMAAADLLLISSGTATLEAAYYGSPMVIVYSATRLTEFLAGFVYGHFPTFFSLPNMIADRLIVPEFIQERFNENNVVAAARKLLDDPEAVATQRRDIAKVVEHLGEPGASSRVAEMALEMIAPPT